MNNVGTGQRRHGTATHLWTVLQQIYGQMLRKANIRLVLFAFSAEKAERPGYPVMTPIGRITEEWPAVRDMIRTDHGFFPPRTREPLRQHNKKNVHAMTVENEIQLLTSIFRFFMEILFCGRYCPDQDFRDDNLPPGAHHLQDLQAQCP